MTNEKIVTQSFVLTDSGEEYTLEYYIYSQPDQNENPVYGITIKESSVNGVESASEILSSSQEEATGIIMNFAKNFVFPTSLQELAEDIRISKLDSDSE